VIVAFRLPEGFLVPANEANGKNGGKKMTTQKMSTILLVLLLAAMVMVPVVSAGDSCSSTPAQESFEKPALDHSSNLLDEFDLQKPSLNGKAVPFLSYKDSKDLSDRIMKQAKISDDTSAVIGMYNFGDSKMLLINKGDRILEAFYDGKSVKTYLLTPQLVGDKTVTDAPQKIAGPEGDSGDYSVETSVRTQLYSVDLIYPGGEKSVTGTYSPLSTYTVTRTRTDVYRNGLGDTIARLITTGVFYVNYGVSITSITNSSSYWINPLFPGWSACSYTYQTSGVGTTSGQLYNHYKFGTLYLRYQMDIWVAVDAWLTGSDGGSTNQWVSLYGDGCTG